MKQEMVIFLLIQPKKNNKYILTFNLFNIIFLKEKIFKMEKILKYLVSLLRNSKRIKKSAFENINTTMHQFYSVYDKF